MCIRDSSGRNTTSCIFRKGKIKAIELLCKPEFEDVRRTFSYQNSTHEEVFETGAQYIEATYKLKQNDKSMSLSQLRHKTFAAKVRKRVDFASLPPTEDAARLHLY